MTFDDLSDRFIERERDVPTGVMLAHFGEIADVADVVADTVLIHVGVDLFAPGEFLDQGKRLQDGNRIGSTASDVINLRDPRGFDELLDETGDVVGVDVIAHLFALVAEDLVFAAFQVAADQIAEEAMQLDARVIRAGEAAATEAAGGHAEVAPVFLDHHVARYLGGAEEAVLGLVDGEILRDAVRIGRIVVVPAGFQLLQGDGVGSVAIDLVGGKMGEGALRASLAGSLQQVQGSHRVHVEVIERDVRRAVVRRLGGGVNDGVRLNGL